MLTQRSTPRTADEQPPGGWIATRFWVGTFGMFVTTFVLCLVAVTFLMSLVLGYRPITVVSGSMEPGISAGDIVLYQPHPLSGIEEGAVIVFDDPTVNGGAIIHRVVGTDPDTGWLQTKGRYQHQPPLGAGHRGRHQGVGRTLVAFIALAAWVARWGWSPCYDPWAKVGPGDRHLRDRVQKILATRRSP